jgi:hypothetical protein
MAAGDPLISQKEIKELLKNSPKWHVQRKDGRLNTQEIQELIDAIDDEEGKKFDTEKDRWDLLPLALINDTVKVITFGAKKYGPNNWQHVNNGKERYYAALMRHIVAYRQGELVDSESGLSHLAHAMCNLIFLSELS